MKQFRKLSYAHRALAKKAYPDAGSLLTPVRANHMPLLNLKDWRRARRFNTLLSKRRIKIENDFKEIKTYKAVDRFGGTNAGSCLVTLLSERRVRLFKTVFKTPRKVPSTVSHKWVHGTFTYWIVYRLKVILNAKTKLVHATMVHVWARFCLCAWPSFIYSCHGITDTYIAVAVAKLYFKAASGSCSTKTSLKTSCLL